MDFRCPIFIIIIISMLCLCYCLLRTIVLNMCAPVVIVTVSLSCPVSPPLLVAAHLLVLATGCFTIAMLPRPFRLTKPTMRIATAGEERKKLADIAKTDGLSSKPDPTSADDDCDDTDDTPGNVPGDHQHCNIEGVDMDIDEFMSVDFANTTYASDKAIFFPQS